MRWYIIYKHWKISFVVEYLAYYANNFFLCSEASKLVLPVSSSLKKVINEMTTTTRQLKRWLTLNGEVFLKITLILIRSLKKTRRKVTFRPYMHTARPWLVSDESFGLNSKPIQTGVLGRPAGNSRESRLL